MAHSCRASDRQGPYRDFYGRETDVPTYRETLPGGSAPVIEIQGDSGFNDNYAVFEVPEGHYFMMGDNRDNRQTAGFSDQGGVGYVPLKISWPRRIDLLSAFGKGEPAWGVLEWPWTVRWDRMLKREIGCAATPGAARPGAESARGAHRACFHR